ncbi:MAG: hypothetical protein Q4C81_10100 [Kocuria sp.]|nr:hypothetical protein [Kocuria sp.]
MPRQPYRAQRRAPDVRGPLAVSAVLGVVAGGVTSFAAAGGTQSGMRLDLGLIAGGVAFIVSVVVCATLMMLDKPNDPALGQGSGVNRSSAVSHAESRSAQRQDGPQPRHDVPAQQADHGSAPQTEPPHPPHQ